MKFTLNPPHNNFKQTKHEKNHEPRPIHQHGLQKLENHQWGNGKRLDLGQSVRVQQTRCHGAKLI